jgi:hypothetical protein
MYTFSTSHPRSFSLLYSITEHADNSQYSFSVFSVHFTYFTTYIQRVTDKMIYMRRFFTNVPKFSMRSYALLIYLVHSSG